MIKDLKNPFESVANKENRIPFIAKSEDLKIFKEYIYECIKNKKSYIPIIGDYGQGKSRLLFDILSEFGHDKESLFIFISIKKARINAPHSEGWTKGFINILFNDVIREIILNYDNSKDTNEKKIAESAIKIKNELIHAEKLDFIKNVKIPQWQHQLENAVGEQREKIQKCLDDEIENKTILELQENININDIFNSFFPAFMRDIQKIGIDDFYIVFDEVEHLYDIEDARVDFIGTRDQFESLKNVHIILACASRVWTKMREDHPEFTSAITPADKTKIIIPPYKYEDLKAIVNQSLNWINQQDFNPFGLDKENYILRNTALYNTTIRSALIVCYELYTDYISKDIYKLSQKEDHIKEVKKIFNEKYHDILVDQNQIERTIDNIIDRFKEKYPEISKFKIDLIDKFIMKKIAFQDFSKDEFSGMINSIIPNTGEEIFKYLFEEQQNILEDLQTSKYRFNQDLFRTVRYIGEEIKAFYYDILWPNKTNNSISNEKAEKLFNVYNNEVKISQTFNQVIDILIEEAYLDRETSEGVNFKLLISPEIIRPKDTIGQYLKDKRISNDEIYKDAIPNLIKYFWTLRDWGKADEYISVINFPTQAYNTLIQKTYAIALLTLITEIKNSDDINDLKKNLRSLLKRYKIIYIVYPFDSCKIIEDIEKFEELKNNRTSYSAVFNLGNEFEKDLRDKCKLFIIYPNKNVPLLPNVQTPRYLALRKDMDNYFDGKVKERLLDLDKNLMSGFSNPTATLITDFHNELKSEFPIREAFLSSSKSGEVPIVSDMLSELFKNEHIMAGSYKDKNQPKLFKKLLNYSFCTVIDGSPNSPTEIGLLDSTELYNKKRIPKEIKYLIESMASNPQDVASIAKTYLGKFEGFEYNESAYSKNPRLTSTIKPILIALSNTFPENIFSEEDDNKFKILGETLDIITLDQIKDIFIPVIEKMMNKGLKPPDYSLEDFKKELDDIKKNTLPSIYKKIENDENYAAILEKKEFSYLHQENISNKSRLKLIINIVMNSFDSFKSEILRLPSTNFIRHPTVKIEEMNREIPPNIKEVINGTKNEILKKSTSLDMFKIKDKDINIYIDSIQKICDLQVSQDKFDEIKESVNDTIKNIPNYKKITENRDMPLDNYDRLVELIDSISNFQQTFESFSILTKQKKEMEDYILKIIEEYDSLPKNFIDKTLGNLNDFSKCVMNCQTIGIPTAKGTHEYLRLKDKIENITINEFSNFNKEKMVSELIGLILYYFDIKSLSEKLKL